MLTREDQDPPTLVIETPRGYERTHELAECPLCHKPNPFLVVHMPVRDFGFFDANLYNCDTVCECGCEKPHQFSAKHEILKDAAHLKIYDRTHSKGAWRTEDKSSSFKVCDKCNATYPNYRLSCSRCNNKNLRSVE